MNEEGTEGSTHEVKGYLGCVENKEVHRYLLQNKVRNN